MSNNNNNTVTYRKPNRNIFDLSFDRKMTAKIGILYPCLIQEVLPGDKFTIGCEQFTRFAPLKAPVMHRADIFIEYFFCPNRCVWENWEAFINGGNDGGVPVAATMPFLTIDGAMGAGVRAFMDYYGIPDFPVGGNAFSVTALPFAMYNWIWNEYYRNQKLHSPVDFELVDGLNDYDLYCNLKYRCWEKDFLTASLPSTQQGAPVQLPLGSVILDPLWDLGSPPNPVFRNELMVEAAAGDIEQFAGGLQSSGAAATPIAYDPEGSLIVSPTTINDLRTAFHIQEWLEKQERGGSRYTESIWSHFGVRSADGRLQRPEYITGVKIPVVISEVLNTTGTDDAPQGAMAGHGISYTSGKSGSYYATEHGYIIGLYSCRPRTAYQNGIPKKYLRYDYTDYYFPSFAHLGEVPILQAEAQAYKANQLDVFGYRSIYDEYRQNLSEVCGEFRTSLNYWHMGRIFLEADNIFLNEEFVECRPDDVSRVFNLTDPEEDHLWLHILHRIKASRLVPIHGDPGGLISI